MSHLRDTVLAIGRAVLPPGRVLPGFGEATADRVLRFVTDEGRETEIAYHAALAGLEAAARLRTGRRLAALSPERRLDVLRGLERLSYPTRMAVKSVLAPIKTLHFDDPALFAALGVPYRPAPAARERSRVREQQVFDGDGLAGVGVLEADVVVVGTGAGGAVVAAELARRGHHVVMLEAGRYLDRADFTRLSRVELTRAAYLPIQETTAVGNVLLPILAGRAVGGSTTVNSGTCYRAPDEVLDGWARDLGLEGLGPRDLAPHFDRVEQALGVAPTAPDVLGGCADVIARGCEALGYAHGPLSRNAVGCDGQGVCCFGCPTDAKRSMNVTFVPAALKAGALLVTGARVDRVLVRGGVAYGVSARVGRADAPPARLTVRASRVVLACGTLRTPLVLMRDRLASGSGQLGRNLSVHPATAAYARFDHLVDGSRGVPQGYAIEEFQREGLLFEGAFTPVEMLALDMRPMGPELTELMEAYRHLAAFGFMIKDTSRGRVTLGPGGRPLITYSMNHEDGQRLSRALKILVGVFRAAGARKVYANVQGHVTLQREEDYRRLQEARLGPRDFDLSAYHPLGTARMAARAGDGVVDTDHEVFGTERLHVVDGSVVPGSLGVNPQITIMALASRAAERLHARLSARGLTGVAA